MYETYKPSGRISFIFFPVFVLNLIIITPVFSFLNILQAWFIHSVIINTILYFLCAFLFIIVSGMLNVKAGKVRNTKIAVWSGIVLLIWFCYLSLIILQCFRINEISPVQIYSALLHPSEVLNTLKSIVQEGYMVKPLSGREPFTFRGSLMIISWILKFLISFIFMLFYPYFESVQPFCEDSGKWYKAYKIVLKCIDNPQEFKNKIIAGDLSELDSLESLTETNTDYCSASLYVPGGNSCFYVSLTNNIRDKKTDSGGNIRYEENDIVELFPISRESGSILLEKGKRQDVVVSVKVVDEEVKSKIRVEIIKVVLLSVIQIAALYIIFTNHELAMQFFTQTKFLFFLIANAIVWGADVYGIFANYIYLKDENGIFKNRAVNKLQLTQNETPLLLKLYLFFMFIVSLGLLIYGIVNVML